MEQATLRIASERRRERVGLTLERLDLEHLSARIETGGDDPGHLAGIMRETGTHVRADGCRNLAESAQVAVRAGFTSRRHVSPATGGRSIAHFVAITEAVDFAMLHGDDAFALLCRMSEDADLPLETLQRAVLTSGVMIASAEPPSESGRVAYLPHSVPHKRAWRTVLGLLAGAAALVVLAALVYGAGTVVGAW
jgi:hypothetical protein